MLFNSPEFLLCFLPLTLAVVTLLARWCSRQLALLALFAASLVFYSYWYAPNLLLLLLSIGFNFGVAALLRRRSSRWLLAGGVAVNIALLGYFKYAGFAVRTYGDLCGVEIPFESPILPLAISFFTFQQIAYLVETARGRIGRHSLLDYGAFVSFFPQLIAGPIVRFGDVASQLRDKDAFRPRAALCAAGVTALVIGLFKKLIIADSLIEHVNPVFTAAAAGQAIPLTKAWAGALAYTFQLYFDFSGYADMAIGLGLIFGIHLPINFASPYKAWSISEFWRRWHVTLSSFLRDFLYIPLGGNRRGRARQLLNLMVVMLLGGLWHGANWTFVVWGGYHGVLLVIGQMIRGLHLPDRLPPPAQWAWRPLCIAVTFGCVVVGWVVFRADSLSAAGRILTAMAGLEFNPGGPPHSMSTVVTANAAVLPGATAGSAMAVPFFLRAGVIKVGLCAAFVWLLPNTQQLMAGHYTRLDDGAARSWLRWSPSPITAVILSGMSLWCLYRLRHVTEFLYFNF